VKFRQLYDPKTQTTYTVDEKSNVFGVSSDSLHVKTHLKPHHLTILLSLFKEHPGPVRYKTIMGILENNQLACPDDTRLHRKVSELRSFLVKMHPGLKDFIINTRGVGYNLPIYLKDPIETIAPKKNLRSKRLQKAVEQLQVLVKASLDVSNKCQIVKMDGFFFLKRSLVGEAVEEQVLHFCQIKEEILTELKRHQADFLRIRIEFTLAKLKTYVALARVSEFSITKEQWLDWHEHEANHVLQELIELLQKSEQV